MRRKTAGLMVTIGLVLVVAGAIWVVYGRTLSGTQAQTTSAAALHKDAIVVDGHVHIITPVFHQGIDPWKVQQTGLFDYARAKQGGLDVVIHAVYIEDAYTNYNYTVKQACRLIERFYQILDANRDKMELALTSADVRRIVANGKMAAILALEGGFDMEGDLDVLRLFYRLGVRMVQFTNHNTTNVMADVWTGEQKWGGITDKGREVIREMNRLGILIDISHASEKAAFQITEASHAPVVHSHGGLRRFSNHEYATTDMLLKTLAAKGGMIAMIQSAVALISRFTEWENAHLPAEQRTTGGPVSRRLRVRLPNEGIRSPENDYGKYIADLDAEMHDKWVRPREDRGGNGYGKPWRQLQQELIDAGAPFLTDEEWAEQVEYVVKLVGEDHVGIGLDLMRGGAGLRDFDATSYGRFTEAMLKRGLSSRTIRKVLGENWLRLIDAAQSVRE